MKIAASLLTLLLVGCFETSEANDARDACYLKVSADYQIEAAKCKTNKCIEDLRTWQLDRRAECP